MLSMLCKTSMSLACKYAVSMLHCHCMVCRVHEHVNILCNEPTYQCIINIPCLSYLVTLFCVLTDNHVNYRDHFVWQHTVENVAVLLMNVFLSKNRTSPAPFTPTSPSNPRALACLVSRESELAFLLRSLIKRSPPPPPVPGMYV